MDVWRTTITWTMISMSFVICLCRSVAITTIDSALISQFSRQSTTSRKWPRRRFLFPPRSTAPTRRMLAMLRRRRMIRLVGLLLLLDNYSHVHGVNAMWQASCTGVNFQDCSRRINALSLDATQGPSTMAAKLVGRWRNISTIFQLAIQVSAATRPASMDRSTV